MILLAYRVDTEVLCAAAGCKRRANRFFMPYDPQAAALLAVNAPPMRCERHCGKVHETADGPWVHSEDLP